MRTLFYLKEEELFVLMQKGKPTAKHNDLGLYRGSLLEALNEVHTYFNRMYEKHGKLSKLRKQVIKVIQEKYPEAMV